MKNDEADGDKKCNCSCGSLFSESERSEDEDNNIGDSCKERQYTWFNEHGVLLSRKLTEYECSLEDEVQKLQDALFSISSHYAKIQFRLRQIAGASGNERLCLLRELQRITCQGIDASRDNDELPTLMSDAYNMGDVRVRQHRIISQLRSRLSDLSKVTDSGFCVESESSYNLRKYERARDTALCEITSDGIVQHGRYCSCVICREEFAKMSASQRGYLAETWPATRTIEDEFCGCKVDGESKAKGKGKKGQKRKSKKSSRLSIKKLSRHGSLNRYYSMSFEGKRPSTRNQQDTLHQIPSRAKSLQSKASLAMAAGARVSASQRLQKPSLTSNLSRGATSNRRVHSEIGFKMLSQGINRAPSVGKSLSIRGSNQRGPPGSVNRLMKSSSHGIQPAISNGSSMLQKSPSMRATNNSTFGKKCLDKCIRKRSQQDSYTSFHSEGKRLGSKTAVKSTSGKTQEPDGLSLIVQSNSHLESKDQNEYEESKKEKRSLDQKRNTPWPESRSQEPKTDQPKSRRGSMLSRLKSKWNGKSSKKAKDNEKRSIRDDTDHDETENEYEERGSNRESSNKRDTSQSRKKSQNSQKEMEEDDHNTGKRSRDYSESIKGSVLRKSDGLEHNGEKDKNERISRKGERGMSRDFRKSDGLEDDGDKNERMSKKPSKELSRKPSKELSRKNSQDSRKDLDKDKPERKRSTKSSSGNIESRSLRAHEWKQPLGLVYAKNRGNFCKTDCGGKCSKAGQCVKIQSCLKKFEEKTLKNNKSVLKKFNMYNCAEYCAQMLEAQGIVTHNTRPLHRASRKGSEESLLASRECRKCCDRRFKPISSQESYDQDHADRRSIRISKHRSLHSTTTDELDRNRHPKKTSKSSTRDRGSTRKSLDQYYQYPEEKKRTPKLSRRRSDQSIPEEEVYYDYDLRKGKRSSMASIESSGSIVSNRKRGSIPTRSSMRRSNQRALEEDLRKYREMKMSKSTPERHDRDQVGTRRSSKASRRGSNLSFYEDEYGKYQEVEKKKRSSSASRSSMQSQERHDDDRVESRRISMESWHDSDQSIIDDDYGKRPDLEKRKRSSILSKQSTRSPERYDRDRVGTRRSSKASRRSSSLSIFEDDYEKHQDLEKKKRSSILSRQSTRSQDRHDRDRVGTRRSSKASRRGSDLSFFEDEHGKHQDHEKRKKSSSASKKERSSPRKASHDKLDRHRKDSKRSSKLSKRASMKSSTSSKSARGSVHSLESDRISIGREIREISSEGTLLGDPERSSIRSFNPIEELKPNSPVGSASDKTPAQFPTSARSMVEMTTDIARDNTRRSCKKQGICQRRVCIANCTRSIRIVECPYKSKEQTAERIFCYNPSNRPSKSPRPQSKDRASDLECYCIKSQPAHHELLRTYSHNSLLEAPLVYPLAKVIPKNDQEICRDCCANNRKYFEDLSRQTNNSNRMKESVTQATKKQTNSAQEKDPKEGTDC